MPVQCSHCALILLGHTIATAWLVGETEVFTHAMILTSVMMDHTVAHQTQGALIHKAPINATVILVTLHLLPQQLVKTSMNVQRELTPAPHMAATPAVLTALVPTLVSASVATICLAIRAILIADWILSTIT